MHIKIFTTEIISRICFKITQDEGSRNGAVRGGTGLVKFDHELLTAGVDDR